MVLACLGEGEYAGVVAAKRATETRPGQVPSRIWPSFENPDIEPFAMKCKRCNQVDDSRSDEDRACAPPLSDRAVRNKTFKIVERVAFVLPEITLVCRGAFTVGTHDDACKIFRRSERGGRKRMSTCPDALFQYAFRQYGKTVRRSEAEYRENCFRRPDTCEQSGNGTIQRSCVHLLIVRSGSGL
jgi:hypothetical protein